MNHSVGSSSQSDGRHAGKLTVLTGSAVALTDGFCDIVLCNHVGATNRSLIVCEREYRYC